MYRHGTWSMQVGIGGQWIQVWVNDHPLEKYKWNYIAATFDKKVGQIKLYLNGEEVASQATPSMFQSHHLQRVWLSEKIINQ